MRTTLYLALRHEFIALCGESRPGLPPDEAARDLCFPKIDSTGHSTGVEQSPHPWKG
jgi:hypothetical protein